MPHEQYIDELLTRVYYDDWKFPIVEAKLGINDKPDFDFDNIGLLFPENDTTELIYVADQTEHRIHTGTPLGPHVHWRQTQPGEPVFKLAYKLWDNGEEEPADFTTLTTTGVVFPYTSGVISQISPFPAIDVSGFDGLSTQLIFKLWREDNGVYTGDCCVRSVDFHMGFIMPGSRQQYIR